MQLTRRFFLQSTGAMSAYLGVAPFDLLAKAGLWPMPSAWIPTRP